jgi:hypothetical protein
MERVVEKLTDAEVTQIVEGYYKNDQLHRASYLSNHYARLRRFLGRTTGKEFRIEGRTIGELA